MTAQTALLRSEMSKLRTGRILLGTVTGGILMSLLTAVGYLSDGKKNTVLLSDGTTAGQMVRGWMMMMLFTAILGAVLVTREFSSGSISRSVLLGGKTAVFRAKMLVVVSTGLVLGVLTFALSIGVTRWMLASATDQMGWSSSITGNAVGVGACVLLSTIAGGFIGWICRNTAIAGVVVVIAYLIFDPAMQRLVPQVAKFLFSISLTSIYGDPKPDLLPVGWSVVVCLGWIAALALLAMRQLRRQDL